MLAPWRGLVSPLPTNLAVEHKVSLGWLAGGVDWLKEDDEPASEPDL